MLTLQDILDNVPHSDFFPSPGGNANRAVTGACVDSRQASAGCMFVALPGERTDGHLYLADAIARGASVLLVARAFYAVHRPNFPNADIIVVDDTLLALHDLARSWRHRHPMKVIGVTGSVGKTSTKEMIAAVLSQRFAVLKNEQNHNSEVGLPLTLLRLEPDHQRAVLEMAMYYAGDIALLCRIAEPEIGVVTNVGPTHLERMGSVENIRRAKAELVESLPSSGVAVLNGDDDMVRSMSTMTRARVMLCGFGTASDIRAADIQTLGLRGIEFDLDLAGRHVRVRLPLPGRHSVQNALAAAAVGLAEGLSPDEIVAGLEGARDHSRVKALPGLNGSTIIDDSYNASPVSTIAALDLLGEMPGRKIAVLGDMYELGAFERAGHQQVGERAARVVDKLVAVGEKGRLIGEEALTRGLADVTFAPTTAEAADLLIGTLAATDYVLVKGSRGMRMEDIVERIVVNR